MIEDNMVVEAEEVLVKVEEVLVKAEWVLIDAELQTTRCHVGTEPWEW
jgi:hypothetical protein